MASGMFTATPTAEFTSDFVTVFQHFALPVDLSKLNPHSTYTISARIETRDGEPWGISDTRIIAVQNGEVQHKGEVGIEIEVKVL